MYGQASAPTRQVSAAGTANTAAPTSSATAVVACVSSASATSAFHPACSAAEARTIASAATLRSSAAAADQLGEALGGHVPARDRHADAQARGVDPPRQQGGEGARAARLRDGLRALEEQAHRGHDLLVGDGDDLVHEALDDREGELARQRQLLAVGDRARDLDPDAFAGGERAHEVVAGLRLDADHAGVGREGLDRGRAAGEQAAAAEADEQDVERPRVLEQLQRRGALAGHHERLVVRVDGRQPALGDQFGQQRLAVPGVAVEEHDLRAVAARRGELAGRRVVGHQDHRGNLVQPRGERERLGMVARRHGRDAAGTFGGVHRSDRIERAAELEGPHPLQVLGLQQHARGAGGLVERAAGDDRRAVGDPFEPPRRGLDVVERDHGRESRPRPRAGARSRSSCRPRGGRPRAGRGGRRPARPRRARRLRGRR